MAKKWQTKAGLAVVVIVIIYFAYKRKMGPFGIPEVQELLGGLKKGDIEAPSVPQLVQGGDIPGAAGASPNQFQGPSAPIGTGGLSGPQVKPDENVRQTFLREMYKQVYLPYSDYPFLYDNPSFQNQVGTPVRGGDLPPCAPSDDAWFDMWYKMYGFYPPGSTSNQNCTPNPFPNPTPTNPCPAGYKPDRCNCACIPEGTVEIQSICAEAERCQFPQIYPDPTPIPDGEGGGWENCGINPHAPPCCLPPTTDPNCKSCAEKYGGGCGVECDNGTKLTDQTCIACKACFPDNPDAVCRESKGYRWDNALQKCVKTSGGGPSPSPSPSPSSCFKACHEACKNKSAGQRGRCISDCAHTCHGKKPPRIGFGLFDWIKNLVGGIINVDVRDYCKKDSRKCSKEFHGSCNSECKSPNSSKCKKCLCACSGRSNYAVAAYNVRRGVYSTPGYGYTFNGTAEPEGLLIQRAQSARVHLA